MVLNHFGKKSITAQACEQIIGSAVPAALQQKNIRAIGQAQMADDEAIGKMIDNFAPGQDIKFEVLVDIWPEASLKGAYKGLTIEAEEEPFEEELVSNALSEMRKREAFSVLSGADTKAKVYPASLGDSVDEIKREGAVCVVDLIGYKKNADGSKGDRLPDLAIGENVEVVMEKGKFFEGFVESIDGMQAGDQASVPVTFPTNHKVAELRGMEAIFDVTIKGLKDMMYPALDDDFAKKIPNCDSVVALKKRIRESITEVSKSPSWRPGCDDEAGELDLHRQERRQGARERDRRPRRRRDPRDPRGRADQDQVCEHDVGLQGQGDGRRADQVDDHQGELRQVQVDQQRQHRPLPAHLLRHR
mmetsp:Transcript_24872/g.81875  ORF Transcript_24872/g.81875 Transcript_24872/m.81875 type:complete len:360 (+) Transcript_24872:110-1189(+)